MARTKKANQNQKRGSKSCKVVKKNHVPKRRKAPKSKSKSKSKYSFFGGFIRDGSVQQFVSELLN